MIVTVPDSILAGDTLAATLEHSSYPASDGWGARLVLVNAGGKLVATSTADGDLHSFEVAGDETAELAAGRFDWFALVIKGDERYTVAQGEIEVRPDLLTVDDADLRSIARKVLDAIDARLAGKASEDQLEMTVGDQSIKRMSFDELIRARNYFRGRLGEGTARRINIVRIGYGNL